MTERNNLEYYADFTGNATLSAVITYFSLANFLLLIIRLWMAPIGLQQSIFLLFFAALTVVLLFYRHRSYTAVFLLSTFSMIIVWRLCALADLLLLTYLYGFNILLKLFSYMACSYNNIRAGRLYPKHISHGATVYEWQLFFIRLFIGFDLIPHFCEKLFAGDIIRLADVSAFTVLGVPHPLAFVILAGFVEFFAALAISCGFLTRLASIAFVLYLLVASYLGQHFTKGFIWASPGGGWEYPMVWAAIVLTFAAFGAGDFSIDRLLKDRFHLPIWIRYLMGGRMRIHHRE